MVSKDKLTLLYNQKVDNFMSAISFHRLFLGDVNKVTLLFTKNTKPVEQMGKSTRLLPQGLQGQSTRDR